MQSIPKFANLEGERRELKGYTAPFGKGKDSTKSAIFFLTVYPFIFNPSVKRRSQFRGLDYSVSIPAYNQTFYLRSTRPTSCFFQNFVWVLIVYLTRLGTFRHIYIDLAVNLLARFFLKVSCCHFHLLSPTLSSNPLRACERLGLFSLEKMECAISNKIFMLALKKPFLRKS